MAKRYVSIWFRHLLTDWLAVRRPELNGLPNVFATPDHGRMIITAVNAHAENLGVEKGMRVADAKAICPGLEVMDEKPGRTRKLLEGLGQWCIRYSPTVAVDEFSLDGLVMEVSGCPHLWGGEPQYLKEIVSRLKSKGYTVRLAIADTIGSAWAIARFGHITPIIPVGHHIEAIQELPPQALRLEKTTLERLEKLGFCQIKSFISMPRSVLRRRFGEVFLLRLAHALGTETEGLQPLQLPLQFRERLECLEPIKTRTGIELAIQRLLEKLCLHLQSEGKGLRTGVLTCYRIDGKIIRVEVGTNIATYSTRHLFTLFELKIGDIRPALGIELFVLEAPKVDAVTAPQEAIWSDKPDINDKTVIELLDRIAGKVGANAIHRFLPDTHYWPERAFKKSIAITDLPTVDWRTDKPRPTELLAKPDPIEVMAIIPDHPPKFFIYKNVRHQIVKADGPERIEREWWIENGEHRDYYQVEDDQGQRYWLYRSGHYSGTQKYRWYIHGFFA